MEDVIVNKSDLDKFKAEISTFNSLSNKTSFTSQSEQFKFEDYLVWCNIKRLNKLIELLEAKA